MKKRPLIILTGPTAVGKTEISIKLAKAVNGEIISADSMQVYKRMDIGTAKIMPEEMQGVKHYLIDVLEPQDEFNVFTFKKLAMEAMEEIYSKGRIPIIVGGTGFYIQSVLYNIDFSESSQDSSYREELEQIVKAKGSEYLHGMLKKVDSKSAGEIHHNNIKRVIRALEYFHQNNRPISEHNEEQRHNEAPYNFLYICLNDRREKVYERIDRRVDIMFDNGLVEEVKCLVSEGCHEDMISMKGIGYKEVIDYLKGRISLDEARYIIKRNTRHFAKRQLTWFRREKDVTMIDYSEFDNNKEKVLAYMLDLIEEKIEEKN